VIHQDIKNTKVFFDSALSWCLRAGASPRRNVDIEIALSEDGAEDIELQNASRDLPLIRRSLAS
jgi:hypothetical protein